jgi:hypothetical protein
MGKEPVSCPAPRVISPGTEVDVPADVKASASSRLVMSAASWSVWTRTSPKSFQNGTPWPNGRAPAACSPVPGRVRAGSQVQERRRGRFADRTVRVVCRQGIPWPAPGETGVTEGIFGATGLRTGSWRGIPDPRVTCSATRSAFLFMDIV